MNDLTEALRGGVTNRVERWPGNDGEDIVPNTYIASALMREAADKIDALSERVDVLEDATRQTAVDICDAVIQWIVKHDLGLTDDEFSVGDVISILDDLWAAEDDSPGDPKAAEAILRSLATPQLETKPVAFEVLDHVNGTYVTTNEQAALATEFPYNGLYRRVGALEP